MDWDSVRDMFPCLKEYVYLNAASQGLVPEGSIEVMKRYAEQKRCGSMYWRDWYNRMEDLRVSVSRLIGGDARWVSLVPSTTWGINLIANSIEWRSSDNVVITDMEFPANVFPWQAASRRYGFEVRVARNKGGVLGRDSFLEVVDENTRVIAVSWVEFSNGFVNDLTFLSKLAREVGALLVVDAIQGLGVLPMDVEYFGVDVLVSGFQKWLLGTGGALLYVNERARAELRIPFGGWLADENPTDFSFRSFNPARSGKVFELGTPAFLDFLVATESLDLILRIGISTIENRVVGLVQYLRESLLDRDIAVLTPEESRSGILLFSVSDSEGLYNRLIRDGIIVSFRAGGIRVSPHFYNSERDIEALLEVVKKFEA